MPVKRSPLFLLPHAGRVLQLTDKDRRRFKAKLKPVGDKGCLVWTGKPNKHGHGVLWLPTYKLGVLARRAAWIFGGGEITDYEPFVISVCPCGELACCAKEHLRASEVPVDSAAEAAWVRRRRELRTKRAAAKVVVVKPGDKVKLLGLARRPTTAQVVGRKPRPKYRRTCRELYEARKAAWLAKKHQLEMEKLERRREREAREQRRREREERREVLGY